MQRLQRRRGLALSELLLVVVGLAIVLGLIVSLARRVRRESSHALAERVLIELEAALDTYVNDHDRLPEVTPLLPILGPLESLTSSGRPSEEELRNRALANNRQIVRALNIAVVIESAPAPENANWAPTRGTTVLDTLGVLLFDGATLRDPWGTPIVYMPGYAAEVGMAAGDRPFFFSAGPDRRFLTRADNVYSYEALTGEREGVFLDDVESTGDSAGEVDNP